MSNSSKPGLCVVEQSPVRSGGSGADALQETIELAIAVEQLGYDRFWLAEHHSFPSIASISPEILIGVVGAATRRIRVGSGGVMLPHYSAFKVAENFRTLETLYPDRIDLGLGRAPGGDPRTALALAYPGRPRDVREYPGQVDDLIGFLADDLPRGHPFAGLSAGPPTPGMPEVRLLGSGIESARLAADRGLPFSFAHFFGVSDQGPAIVDHYRQHFRPSKRWAEPRVHIAVQVLCAETKEEAEWHASSLKLVRLQMARNALSQGIVPPEEAAAYEYDAAELAFLERSGLRATTGDPQSVRRDLLEITQRYAADELGIVTTCFDFQARRRSFELVAEALLG
jgi:luciferase family oxidoreductase group 1